VLFKIHVEDEPLIMMLKTTPGWARKYIERYDKFGIYIDPGSNGKLDDWVDIDFLTRRENCCPKSKDLKDSGNFVIFSAEE
jgi:hypothetical protein